jgi:cytochrome c oxidase cbb3-type subunit 2
LRNSNRLQGWRGVALAAGTYVYFLIFAQFGFLKRLAELGISTHHLKLVMAAMAAGGILASLVTPRLRWIRNPKPRLQLALFGCAVAAALTLLPLDAPASIVVSFLIGISLGSLTVTLVSHLALWIGSQPLFKVALGTGLGYFVCNIPALFTATPQRIAVTAASVALVCIVVANRTIARKEIETALHVPPRAVSFPVVLIWFTALVWFDSAAFFIIQNSPALKSRVWVGTAHLWRCGSIHLVAALAGAWLLSRRGLPTTLVTAFALLAGACLFLLHPAQATVASVIYPVGVSLYSVALVAYPSYLLGGTEDLRSRRTGWIYAIAGWMGSAMGIGMAQNLHRVPIAFIAAAAVIFLLPFLWRAGERSWRQAAAVVLVCAASIGIEQWISHTHPKSTTVSPTAAERGRNVYIAEGCINCHSQYVRPHSPDVLMWGPVGDLEAIRRQRPPLIGDRRQGPDLSNVGSRRSLLWLRIHQMDPRVISPHSIMPSYAYLFKSQRGDDLLAYVASLKSPDSQQHLQQKIAEWKPSAQSAMEAKRLNGKNLFNEYCATCHEPDGKVLQQWHADFQVLPAVLTTARLHSVPEDATFDQQQNAIAKIIKFGMPGTDMAGHEYLADAQVDAIADWVMKMRASNGNHERGRTR